MSSIAVIDPNARPNLVAGVKPMAIVPQSMDEAYRLAKAVCAAGMAPRGLDTPEKAMVAIIQGLEVGLTPMASLQRIAVVNGRPVIWGDGAMALVRGSGACEWIKETFAGDGEKRTAICEAKRRGDPVAIMRSFSVADAKRAGLWGKQGPWQQYPDRMLQMRARAFCLRDGFADVLGGLYLKEELDDTADAAPRGQRTPPAPPQITIATQAQQPIPAREPAREPEKVAVRTPPNPHAQQNQAPTSPKAERMDFGKIVDEFAKALFECRTSDNANEVWADFVEPIASNLSNDEMDELQNMLNERCIQLEAVE